MEYVVNIAVRKKRMRLTHAVERWKHLLTGYRDACKCEQENAKLLQIDAVLGVQIVCGPGK